MPQEKKLNFFRSQGAGKYDDFISSSREILQASEGKKKKKENFEVNSHLIEK